jgi:DNA-binding response OmpR family regulator
MKRLNLRIALVIEPEDGFRRSAVQFLRSQGWIVHGMRRAEHAFSVLAQIPYNLIVIGSELPGMTSVEFVRVLSNSKEWRKISVIALATPSARSVSAELESSGAFLADKPTWKSDFPRFLSMFENPLDLEPVIQVGAAEEALAGC